MAGIGAGVGVAIILVFAGAVWYLLRRRKETASNAENGHAVDDTHESVLTGSVHRGPGSET